MEFSIETEVLVSLSDFSIRKPVFAWMLMFGLILFGWISFRRMGVSQLPDVDFPIVSVGLTLEGAAPEIIETEAVDPIENVLMTVAGVTNITSSSRNGAASITVEFDLDKNIDVAMQEVQNKISQIGSLLPKNLDPPTISKTNPEDQPIMYLAIQSEKVPRKELMAYVRDVLKDKFSTVPGVGEIITSGYVDPNLRVWLNSKKLAALDITASDVISTISNQHAELPGGYLETATKESNVRTMGEARNEVEFAQLMINQRGGRPNNIPIRLGQLGRIEDGLADVRQVSRTMGETAVGLGIRKQRGSNAVEVSHLVRERITDVEKILPPGVKIGITFDSTQFIEDSIGELKRELLMSAILTGIVCWLFLGSLSSTINILLAIPTSIVGAFTAMYFAGFTLNTFTLLALTLSIGIVVDDAIMMLENIVRHREMGKTRIRAAFDGAREISSAAMITTIAIVAIFAPVIFIKGVIGKFFLQFGVAMTVTVLLSLLEALTITPMRCAQFLDTSERTSWLGRSIEHAFLKLSNFYRLLLTKILNYRLLVMAGSLVFFVLSLGTNKLLNKEFIPPQDQSRFIVRVQTPVGSSLEFTNTKVAELEKYMAQQPAVLRYYVSIGGSDVNTAFGFITLKPKGQRPINPATHKEFTQAEVMASARQELNKIPGLRAIIQDLSSRGFSSGRGFPVEFTITGPNWEDLSNYAKTIMDKLDKTGLVSDLDSDFKLGMPEVQVIPDRDRAAMRAVNTAAIGQTVNALVGGVLAGRYTKGSHRYDVRVRLEPDERTQSEQIKNLYVRNAYGEPVRLQDVVQIQEKPTPQVVSRKNRQRAISVFANIKPGQSQQAAMLAVEKIGKEVLPIGYQVQASGSSQTFKDSFSSLYIALFLGIAVAYMVLASQFNSFIHPVTVLVALPFSISGAFVSLWIAHQSVNIYSMIGLLLLMGIAKKNSILLVEFTNQVRERDPKKSVKDALIEACPVRLRPILMTSFATVAGAVPGALGLGAGSETTVPMAVSVIGGVTVSTILTLFVVPCVYSMLARFEKHDQDEELQNLPGAGGVLKEHTSGGLQNAPA